MKKHPRDLGGYRIGAVARLTGIALPTLRVWERRYHAVQPQRTPKGGRVYSRADIERLGLLRAAVEAGHAISTVAGLGAAEIEQRLASAPATVVQRRWRYAAAGPQLPARLAAVASRQSFELVRSAGTTAGLVRRLRPGEADVVLLEYPGMLPDQARDVLALIESRQPRLVVLTYEFASARVLRMLEGAAVLALRGPLEAGVLLRLTAAMTAPEAPAEPAARQAPPPAQFSGAQLERISRARSSIRCECPQHLTQLIGSLASFERYSAECENLDERDRVLHQLLRNVSGNCRAQLEVALQRVLEAEGLADEVLGP